MKTNSWSVMTVFFLLLSNLHAQEVSPTDSILNSHSEVLNTLKKIKISGYIQPQFQYAQSKGVKHYGNAFASDVDQRFIIRRGRLKVAYESKQFEWVIITENTDRGVSLHDFYGVLKIPSLHLDYTAGLAVRPFGFEQSYSTSTHEGPERVRFSSTLLPNEADLGMKLAYSGIKPLRFEIAVYNGTATGSDFDSYKDLVGRISFKQKLGMHHLSGGVSYYSGGVAQGNSNLFKMSNVGGIPGFVLQDTASHLKGDKVKREYFGADLQYTLDNSFGSTTLRGEWISGTQPGTVNSSESPKSSSAPTGDSYERPFNGISTYFIQNIGKTNLQFVLKYDWYDANTDAGPDDLGVAGSNLTATDIKYSNLGIGLNYYYKNMYLMVFYDITSNEKAKNLAGYAEDLKDNVLTVRTQFKF